MFSKKENEAVESKILDKKFDEFGLGGSFNYYWNYQTLGNVDVGQVTVWHMPFSDLQVQIKLYLQAKKSGNEAELVFRANNLKFYHAWLNKFVLKPTREKLHGHVGNRQYFDHFFSIEGKDSPDEVWVSETAIEESIEAAALSFMEFNDFGSKELSEEEDLTLTNMREFTYMMVSVARFLQERTIDAAKTGDKIRVFFEDSLRKLKMLSRKRAEEGEAPFGALFDFKDRVFSLNRVNLKSRNVTNKKTGKFSHYAVADCFEELRQSGLDSLIPWEDKIKSMKQTLSADTKQKVSSIVSHVDPKGKYTAMVRLLMQEYRTLTTASRTERAAVQKRYGALHAATAVSVEKGIKMQDKAAYDAISNMLRSYMRQLSPVERAAVVLNVAINDMERSKADRPSSFIGIVMEEEWMLLIQELNGEAKETKDRLARCDFEAGETITFVNGHAREGKKHAFIMDGNLPDGTYVIREENGVKYAGRSVSELVESRIAEVDDRLLFVTKAVSRKEDLEEIVAALQSGKSIVLAPGVKAGNKSFSDAVVVDGNQIGKFRSSVGQRNDVGLRNFFYLQSGKIATIRRISYQENNRWQYAAIVVLKDTRKMELEEFAGIAENAPVRQVKTAKKVPTSRKVKFMDVGF